MDAPVRGQAISAEERPGKFSGVSLRQPLIYAAELAAVTIAYFAAAKLGLMLASINPSATPIWPATGLALGAALLFGNRIAPAIFLGALIANATTTGTIFSSLGIATGNMLESVIGAYCINRWSGGRATFENPGRVAMFVLVCLVPSTMTSASVGVVSLALAGLAAGSDLGAIWMTWWMGDVAGALVVTPVVVLWGRSVQRLAGRQDLLHTLLVYGAAIAVGLIAFSPLFKQSPTRTPLAFLAILPLMWAAVRRNQRDTATTAFLLSCFAVWGTVMEDGPFVRASLNESFLLLLAFMIGTSVPSLALSADVAERKRHQDHVDFVMHELSHRSKNLLSMVQSMANRVGRQTDNFDAFFAGFSTRLRAFAETHDLLVVGDWRGAGMRDLVRIQMAPFGNLGQTAITGEGPDLNLSPKAAEQLGLALHELGTNAAKHGALLVPGGTVSIRWEFVTDRLHQDHLRFVWKEKGGPAVVPPQRFGFGKLVITSIVPASLQGTASLEFEPDGVKWVLLAPSANVLV